jgi:mannose-6-phosphate isomerase
LKLITRRVEKPWGRDALPPSFGDASGRRIGEIWYEDPARPDLPLLPKFLFTSERLSIQVHPSAEQAALAGIQGVRAECWYVVEAEEGATVGYGFKEPITPEIARQAANDGSLQDLLAWHPVAAGDFIFVPSGVVHAIGAGLTIVEFQQSFDVTYRLFDYGRGRPLQLDDALAVADFAPADPANFVHAAGTGDRILISRPQFTVARVSGALGAEWMTDRQRWVVAVSGNAGSQGEEAGAGECLLLEPGEKLDLHAGTTALVAADGPFE